MSSPHPAADEQRDQAIDRLEKALGLADQPRVVIIHEKHGREHCHIIWSRTDLEHNDPDLPKFLRCVEVAWRATIPAESIFWRPDKIVNRGALISP